MAKKLYFHKEPWFREYLSDAYLTRHLTMSQIGQEVGCTAATILGNLRRFNITSRVTSECNRGRKLTEAHIEAIRKRHAGKIVSSETRFKLSESRKKGHYQSPNWNGGKRTKRTDKYIQVYKPEHPFASKEGYVMEHRLIVEQTLGRYLTKDEVVHHINLVRNDNRPENLKPISFKEHAALHMRERWRKKNAEQSLSRRKISA